MTDNNETNLNFKILDRAGVKTLVAWAQSEGWNPGLSDAELFYAADPEGFLGCFLDDQMVGGGSIVSYEGNFGFMGLFRDWSAIMGHQKKDIAFTTKKRRCDRYGWCGCYAAFL